MSSLGSRGVGATMVTVAGSSRMPLPEDRRRHKRLPVTVSARVIHAETSYRTEILDVSDEGMLLAPIGALTTAEQQIIQIDSAVLGRVRAKIVCVSEAGIHAQIELSPTQYQAAVQKLFELTQAWNF